MKTRLLFLIVFIINMPVFCVLMLVSAFIMTPVIGIMWIIFGECKYDLFGIWSKPMGWSAKLPYRISGYNEE